MSPGLVPPRRVSICQHCVVGVVMWLALMSGHALPTRGGRHKVVLVSMDGFRHDYLTKTNNTPNFDAMIASGVTMPYLNNTFISLTFPSHYSMVTGTFPEWHGVVANKMYDPKFDAYFKKSTTEARWWNGNGVEPVWVTARKAGLKVGVYFWPGSTTCNNGYLPNEYRDYDSDVPFEDRVHTLVQWMTKANFDLGLIYFNEPDYTGHRFGPDSAWLAMAVERMDSVLGLLVSQLAAAGIADDVNLIVTSDHGMANVNTTERLIDVSEHVNSSLLLEVVQQGPAAHLRPQPGKAKELVEALKNVPHMKVMLKEDIPEEKHYKNHRRVTPVFALADDGYQITGNRTRRLRYPFLGDHGFDDDLLTMRPIFVARGPDFRSGEIVPPIKNVDIYPLVCHLLSIQPADNNGSLARAKTLLKQSSADIGTNSNSSPNHEVQRQEKLHKALDNRDQLASRRSNVSLSETNHTNQAHDSSTDNVDKNGSPQQLTVCYIFICFYLILYNICIT